jgi:hypothetical protein
VGPRQHEEFDAPVPDEDYDRWLVRFPDLRRAVHAQRVTVAAVCFLLVGALVAPAIVGLSRHAGATPTAGAPAATTTTIPTEAYLTNASLVPAGTTTTTATTTNLPAPFDYTGIWDDTFVTLSEIDTGAAPPTAGVVGRLTAFSTDDPAVACLIPAGGPAVLAVSGVPGEFLVQATSPADCTTADFVFTTTP